MQAEHSLPHVHAIYGDDVAEISIAEGKILDGWLPSKALSMVREWIELHRDELQEIWDTQEFKPIDPLIFLS